MKRVTRKRTLRLNSKTATDEEWRSFCEVLEKSGAAKRIPVPPLPDDASREDREINLVATMMAHERALAGAPPRPWVNYLSDARLKVMALRYGVERANQRERARIARDARTATKAQVAPAVHAEIERLARRKDDWGNWVFGARAIYNKLRSGPNAPSREAVGDVVKATRASRRKTA